MFAEHWERYRLSGGLPVGVVAGPANGLPREWARAWQVCRSGDAERMDQVKEVVAALQLHSNQAAGHPTIACFKRALLSMGVITSAAVATGTPQLLGPAAERFDRAFAGIQAMARERIGSPWASVPSGDFDAAVGVLD